MALTNAERQKRFRDRRKAAAKPIRSGPPVDRRPRHQRWTDAVDTLVRLQEEYRDWYDALPEAFHDTTTGERLEAICDLDLSGLEDATPPRGYGRD